MYSNQLNVDEVIFEATDAADERTIAWLKRDLERRTAQRAQGANELVSSK